MKVILTEYVYKHGVAGEIVKVADGFARNFLIPKRMAIPATRENMSKLTDLQDTANENRADLTRRVLAAASQIHGVELIFGMKAGSNNKLYGSITTQMLKDALQAKTGVDINRRRISDQQIRELGRYDVPVRMGEANPTLHVVVMREEEVNAYLANKEKAAAEAAQAAEQAVATANVTADVTVTATDGNSETVQAEPAAE